VGRTPPPFPFKPLSRFFAFSFPIIKIDSLKKKRDEGGNETKDGTEILLLIGPPASGKSTIVTRYFSSYQRINQDSLRSVSKCLSEAKHWLEEGVSVVIDNTNKDQFTRSKWLDLSQTFSPPISLRVIVLSIPKPLCLHMNLFRRSNPFSNHDCRKVPEV